VPSPTERREALKAVFHDASGCTRCPQLAATRTQVVFGAGNADAEVMFVGEAPGANEDRLGVPFVGQAGKLLDKLLEGIGLARADVFVANVLKCLRYDTPVQLGDGSWERIGRLVRTGYAGTVMSVEADGHVVPRRVTGWHASPRGDRPLYRLTYRSGKGAGAGKVSTTLTGDHAVLTERGYVAARDLRPGDRVATGQGLSRVAFDVACGTMLGDGSIRAASSALTFGHSARQAGYAAHKLSLLAELGGSLEERTVAAVAGGDVHHDVVHARTLAHRALRTLRGDFYTDRKVVPPWVADRLSPRMLAFWFMDDGCTRIRGGGRRPLAEIATNAFSDADLQVLIAGLARLGLPAKASRQRLYFDAATTRRLSELIAPHVPPSMRYKLHPDVEAAVPFAPGDSVPERPVTMFDEVEVEPVPAGADQTMFCLDVADTHNFVTAGGVVHNCRPPGNRDPAPSEIESCRGWLSRQLELIEPVVVCTLGNFATKLLRGEPVGITRLHGREEVRVLGPRAVRLYPLFHPAAALYTPSNVELLRADFARIPGLVALGAPPQPEPEARSEPAEPREPEAAAPEPPDPELAAPDPEPAAPDPELAAQDGDAAPAAGQLGLF
jgi:uracil-DNA glycosylase